MAVPSLFTQVSTWLTVAAAAVCVLAIACSDDAAPGECIDSAERVGVPDAVIDWMKQPSDELGSIERVAIREALEKFGLGEACSKVADNLGLAINLIPDTPSSVTTKEPPTEEPTVQVRPSTETTPAPMTPATPLPPDTPVPSDTPTPSPSIETASRADRPRTPATPLPPDTPVPSDTPTPSPSIETASRADRPMMDYVIHERYDDYPEVIGLEHKGAPGDSDSRFVVVLDELVHVEDRKSVRLRVWGPGGYEGDLELRTLTSSRRPSSTLEFGPVEQRLTRLYSLEGSSHVLDGEGHDLQFDSDELRRHPNALFLSPDYATDIHDRSLVRCAAVMEFNDVSPILIRSLRTVDTASLGDTERFEWYTTLINELGSVSVSTDMVEFDFDQGDFLRVLRHPCAVLWSEVVNAQNADKRNARGECRPHDPDVSDLLEAPYLSLTATDRLVLKRELGGWDAVYCLIYYPQLYTGLWIPLPLKN